MGVNPPKQGLGYHSWVKSPKQTRGESKTTVFRTRSQAMIWILSWPHARRGMVGRRIFSEETHFKEMRCDLCRKSPLKGIRANTVEISDFCSYIHKLCFFFAMHFKTQFIVCSAFFDMLNSSVGEFLW